MINMLGSENTQACKITASYHIQPQLCYTSFTVYKVCSYKHRQVKSLCLLECYVVPLGK